MEEWRGNLSAGEKGVNTNDRKSGACTARRVGKSKEKGRDCTYLMVKVLGVL